MADLAQVIAAVATGALLTVAAGLVLRVYGMQRRAERDGRAGERERRIEAAVTATVTGVETLRQQARADPGESFLQQAPEGAVEVHSKAHLRMLVSEGEAIRSQADCGHAATGSTRRQQVRGSRR